MSEKKRGKRTIIVRSESGIEREHLITHGKHLRVHSGDIVRAGDALVDGPLVPHDILRISGEEAVQQYLTREIQNVYRSQRVEINDKHIEIIVARMLRKVRIEHPGDTNLLPGSVMDKFDFRQANDAIMECLKITDKGDSEFAIGSIVPKDVLEQANAQIEASRRHAGQGHEAEASHGQHAALGHHQGVGAKLQLHLGRQLPGNDQGAHRSRSGRRTDHLVGLKENVILGHLIPAGTGFRTIHESEVRIRPEALEALAAEKGRVLERAFPLLQGSEGGERGGNGDGAPSRTASNRRLQAVWTLCWAAASQRPMTTNKRKSLY